MRRDLRQQWKREPHDLGRHAVGEHELLDGSRLDGQVLEHLVPPLVRDRARRLRDVAEQRQPAGRGAPRHHPELHRCQVLRLVHDDVPERLRPPVDQLVELVEERDVGLGPLARPAREPERLHEDALGDERRQDRGRRSP